MPSSLAEALYAKLRPLQQLLSATIRNVRHPRQHLNAYFNRSPNIEFDSDFYKSVYLDIPKGEDPWIHYCRVGKVQGRLTKSLKPEEFDEGYYLQTNPDVKESKIHPQDHYHRFGKKEGRNPLPPLLSTDGSSQINPVLIASSTEFENKESLNSASKSNPEVAKRAATLMNELNCSKSYLRLNPDLHDIDPVDHWSTKGMLEGRSFCDESDATGHYNKVPENDRTLSYYKFSSFKHYVICYSKTFSPSLINFVHLLGEYLRDLGAKVTLASCSGDLQNEEEYEYIIISCNRLIKDTKGWKTFPPKTQCLILNLEFCFTNEFSSGLESLLSSPRNLLDIYAHNAYLLNKCGCTCSLLDLNAVYSRVDRYIADESPSTFALTTRKGLLALKSPKGSDEKPIDVLFIGPHSDRASRVLVALSSTLAHLNCCIIYKHEFLHKDSLLRLVDVRLLAHASRYVLEIAPDDYPEMDALRFNELCNGTQVTLLTEKVSTNVNVLSLIKHYGNIRALIAFLKTL